jgi:heterodisulfide reductase subunit B
VKRIGYYPGCSLHATAVEFDTSLKAICQHFGIELVEIADWNCCGSSPAHNNDGFLAAALAGRNLVLAAEQGLEELVAPCASCFSRLKAAQHDLEHNEAWRAELEKRLQASYQSGVRIRSILDFLHAVIGLDALRDRIVGPGLAGLKVASYYGCLFVRPQEILGRQEQENPQEMDMVVNALGGQAVDWPFKTECCGNSLALARPDVAQRAIKAILDAALGVESDCIATACPLCHANLDMRQGRQGLKMSRALPVFYITQLVGLACGLPAKELGVDQHLVSTRSLLSAANLG